MIEQEEKMAVMMNSANYFMLPMLQLNKSSYGVGNFINSYVDTTGYIIVDIKKGIIENVSAKNTYDHPQYVTDFDTEDGVRIVYQIPAEFKYDINTFVDGKYSQFSTELKVLISKYSNLKGDNIHIKCLNPQKEDRQKIADDLGVRVDLVRELKSAPVAGNFITIK